MKTVVTGGADFIGSHLVKRLVEQGREVAVADDFSRGERRHLRELGLALKAPIVDLRDYRQALRALRGADTVFHLAARVGSVEFLHSGQREELLALQTNLLIDANVFRACLESSVQRLVYASSVAVYPIDYQHRDGMVLREEDLPYTNPEGGYGWAKLMGELQLQWISGLRVGIARLFNVYGENEEPDSKAHMVPSLIRKAILWPQEEFRVWGDGHQTRDLLYVSDAVEALLRLEERASSPPLVVNIGSSTPVSVAAAVAAILQISGKAIAPVYDPLAPVGPRSRTADISRARATLGWQPQVSLSEGLARTYSWVERRLRVQG